MCDPFFSGAIQGSSRASAGRADPATSIVHFPADTPLYGAEGASKVFEAITARSTVTKVNVAHHHLGSEGAVELFKRLSSPAGRRYRHQITTIDLAHNHIGDVGLEAISDYLLNNRKLKTLILQRNNFAWNEESLAQFVAALNSSRLQSLSLNGVPHGDIFVPYILSHLTTPYLKTLRVSMTNLCSESAPAIVDFLTSARCRLYALTLNGNSLAQDGVDAIISALPRNFSLKTLDIFANVEGDYDYSVKKPHLVRNAHLQEIVAREALDLLRTSRALLLPGTRSTTHTADATTTPSPSSPFAALPLELKQHILSFTAPHLSTPQRLHIYAYAASPFTLPLPSTAMPKTCLPDPSAIPLGLGGGPASACANGTCMGAGNSILCDRENRREDWLLSVGCDVPDAIAAEETANAS